VGASGKTVLVVDDEFSIVETLTEILAWEGFRVRSASNGRQALEALRAERPDVILLDVMMPVMDGHQLLDAMQADGLKDIPVVLMSAAPIRPGPRGPLWKAELRKPFDVSQLMATLRAVLGS